MAGDAGSSIRVDDEAGECAVFVAVAAVRFASVELDEDLIARVQVQDHAVAGVVVVLVRVLSNGAGPDLAGRTEQPTQPLCGAAVARSVGGSRCSWAWEGGARGAGCRGWAVRWDRERAGDR